MIINWLKERLRTDEVARHGSIMVVFSLLAAVFNYFYQLSMGMMLTPAQYGIVMSLISLLVILSVFAQTIQISVTQFISRFKAQGKIGMINYLWRFSLKRSLLLGIASSIVLSLLTPLISRFLNIDNNWYAFIVFTSFILVFMVAVNFGVLQGLQRFLFLGFSNSLLAFFKLFIAALLVYLGLEVSGGLLALPLSALMLFIVTLVYFRDLGKVENEKFEVSGFFSYAGLTLLAIVSFTVLTNVDVFLMKHYLNADDAGNYSAISVLGRVALFIPMGITIAMFPKSSELSEMGGSHRSLMWKALLYTVILAGGIVTLYGLFPDFIVNFVFRGKYLVAIPYLFKYGLAMMLFAVSYILMNYFLSLKQTKVAYSLLGVMILQVCLIAFFHSDIAQVVNIMLICGFLSSFLMLPFYYLKARKGEARQHL